MNYFIDYKKLSIIDEKYNSNVLDNTWFVQNPIDLEHKYYTLMAYLQKVDKNVSNGFLFKEFDTLEKRYKDLESFINTYEIVNKDSESEDLFNYVYGLSSTPDELNEVDEIALNSIDILKEKYTELLLAITFLKDNISITYSEITDRRKPLHLYIEMCNCSILEHYTISKSGKVDYKGSFYSETGLIPESNDNVLEIKTRVSLHSKGTIIPYIVKTILSKN